MTITILLHFVNLIDKFIVLKKTSTVAKNKKKRYKYYNEYQPQT